MSSIDQHIATEGLSFEVTTETIEGLYPLDVAGIYILAIAEMETIK